MEEEAGKVKQLQSEIDVKMNMGTPPKKEIIIGSTNVIDIIQSGYYVDKTEYAKKIIEKKSTTFLLRPRRFGKSLLVETLAAIAKGDKRTFENYHIGKPENGYNWVKYPVIQLDFSIYRQDNMEVTKSALCRKLRTIAGKHGITIGKDLDQPEWILEELIDEMLELDGYERKVMVLIDEYDSLFGESIESPKTTLAEQFFTMLKACNKNIILFVTGVTTFKVSSIFSGFNNYNDISLHREFAAVCGYTKEEMIKTFEDKLSTVSSNWSIERKKTIKPEDVMECLADYYNGYKFSWSDVSVFNPWSIVKFFESEGILANHWYETGGRTTLLMDQIKSNPEKFQEVIECMENSTQPLTAQQLRGTTIEEELDIISLMYQTGYLTIKSCDESKTHYILGIPNKEVQYALINDLAEIIRKEISREPSTKVNEIVAKLDNVDITGFVSIIKSSFAQVSNFISSRNTCEANYHNNLILFMLALKIACKGLLVKNEIPTSDGRIDMVLETKKTIYIIELKYKSNVEIAYQQILDKKYYEPFLNGTERRNMILLGINLSASKRNIDDYKAMQLNIEETIKTEKPVLLPVKETVK